MVEQKENTDRHYFVKGGAVADVAILGAGFLGSTKSAVASTAGANASDVVPTPGDVAILQFLAASELVKQNLRLQYAGPAAHNQEYREALSSTDPSGPTCAALIASDEGSRANCISVLPKYVKAKPVNLDASCTLASTAVRGSNPRDNLVNLIELTGNASWSIHYRSEADIDLRATFPQLIELSNIPLSRH